MNVTCLRNCWATHFLFNVNSIKMVVTLLTLSYSFSPSTWLSTCLYYLICLPIRLTSSIQDQFPFWNWTSFRWKFLKIRSLHVNTSCTLHSKVNASQEEREAHRKQHAVNEFYEVMSFCNYDAKSRKFCRSIIKVSDILKSFENLIGNENLLNED